MISVVGCRDTPSACSSHCEPWDGKRERREGREKEKEIVRQNEYRSVVHNGT